MHSKCSQADIAHNSANCSHAPSDILEQIKTFKLRMRMDRVRNEEVRMRGGIETELGSTADQRVSKHNNNTFY